MSVQVDVSIVVPIFDEADSVGPLYKQLEQVFHNDWHTYEIIFVDDGSRDGSLQRLRALAATDPRVKVIQLRRNYGQTAATQAGLQMARGDVIVTMDGDLQNDPADIPMMLDKLDEGFDLVHGWRKDRKDALWSRRIPSRIANWIISKTTGFAIHDLGCTLKAMRREIAQDLELYGEMHRFIPILAYQRGARCVEVVTRHHARQFGQTKYGIGRTFRVVLDLLTVKFLLDYFASPMKLFGMIALWSLLGSAIAGTAVVAMKWLAGVDMTGNPLLLLTALLVTSAIQFFSLGLLGEVNARTYFGAQNKNHYTVRELINFSGPVGSDPVDVEPKPKEELSILAALIPGRFRADRRLRNAG